jgi:oxygen-dependent protoporphyrinogen oxidase
MGKSFLDYAIDPFIIGVYAGDPARLVPKYALPKLYNLEQQYGSFIGGTLKKQFRAKTEEEKQITRGVFSVKGGISSLISALEKNIGKDKIILKGSEVKVQMVDEHFEVSYKDAKGELITMGAKKVISTIGAHQLGKVMPFIDPVSMARISSLQYTKVLEVILGYKVWDGMKLDAFGGLIPFVEKRDLLGVLFMSALFKDRAPEGGALFSIFLGGVRRPEICDLSEKQIRELLQREFCDLMHLKEFKPDLLKIIFHSYAIPQYEADSGERFRAIADLEQKYPGLVIGGNLRDGIGMADRIQQAKNLAESIG